MLAVLIKLGFSTAELVAAFVCEENSILKETTFEGKAPFRKTR